MFFRNHKTVPLKDESLTTLLRHLYAHEIDLAEIVSDKAIGKELFNRLYYLFPVQLIGTILLHFQHVCNSKSVLIDVETNTIRGELDKYGNLHLKRQGFIFSHVSHLPLNPEIRKIFDYNHNGIFGEGNENELCEKNEIYNMIYNVFMLMFSIQVLLTCFFGFYRDAYPREVKKNNYEDLYQLVKEKIESLEKNYDNLSEEEKEELVNLDLAEKDSSNKITLKYICPISSGLMVWPALASSQGDNHQMVIKMYDLKSILGHLEEKINSDRAINDPLRGRPIKKIEFIHNFHDEYIQYLTRLESYLNQKKQLRKLAKLGS